MVFENSCNVTSVGLCSNLLSAADGILQVEPLYMELFLQWKRAPCLDPQNPFLACIVSEDILPCLRFANESVSSHILMVTDVVKQLNEWSGERLKVKHTMWD
jgi:hypothetical protein